MKLRETAIVVCVAALAAGCGQPAGPASDGNVFTLNNTSEPETLDPALMTGLPDLTIADGLFEGLVTLHPRTLHPQPGIADTWDVSPDGLTYAFHLRPARWSNGEPLTAADFVYSWQRVLDRKTASQYAYQLFYVKGARDFNAGRLDDFSQVGVKALDEHTLRVELTKPTPYFLELCAFATLSPVHRKTIETHGDKWTRPGHLVGSGPFTLAEWKPQQHVLLKKNPHYWDAANVKLDAVRLLAIVDPETAFKSYEYGDTDWLRAVPRPRLPQLRKRPDFRSDVGFGIHFYRFNVTRKPFDDVRVRMAFNLAIDKRQLCELLEGGEQPARSFVPPGTNGYTPVEGPDYDPRRARELLAAVGYPDGRDFPKVDLLYNTNETHRAVAQRAQKMWKEQLGVDVGLVNQEWKVYLNTLRLLDYQIARSVWIGDYNDANTFLDMFVTDGPNNRTGWSNKTYDALIAEAARTAAPPDRERLLQQAEKVLVADELPIMTLYYDTNYTLLKPRIGGFEPNIRHWHPLKHIVVRQ
jgi:oligopeptide transport system substrate-binding protein